MLRKLSPPVTFVMRARNSIFATFCVSHSRLRFQFPIFNFITRSSPVRFSFVAFVFLFLFICLPSLFSFMKFNLSHLSFIHPIFAFFLIFFSFFSFSFRLALSLCWTGAAAADFLLSLLTRFSKSKVRSQSRYTVPYTRWLYDLITIE